MRGFLSRIESFGLAPQLGGQKSSSASSWLGTCDAGIGAQSFYEGVDDDDEGKGASSGKNGEQLFRSQLRSAAESQHWDVVRGMLVKASGDINKYLANDGSLLDLLKDLESLKIPKPLLVMFSRRLVKQGNLVHSFQILKWVRSSTIQQQVQMVATLKDYTKVTNVLLKKSKSFKARDVNPYKQRAYEMWLDMQKVYGDKLDAAAVRCGMNACVMTMRTEEAESVFEEQISSSEADAVFFNILIKGFGFEKKLHKLDQVVTKMRKDGVKPTESTYNTLVNAYVNSNRIDKAWQAMQEAVSCEGGEDCDVMSQSKQYMYASIMKGLVQNMNPKESGMQQALDLMKRMKAFGMKPDVYVYAQLMDHLIKKRNDVDAAVHLFEQMKKENSGEVAPNVVVYNILLGGYCNQQSSHSSKNGVGWSRARCLELLKEMGTKGVKPNTSTFNTLISAAVSNSDHEAASTLYKLMSELKVEPDRFTFTTIMKNFSDQRKPEEVQRVFRQLDSSPFGGADKIAFNCLIGAYGKAGRLAEAEQMYNQMLGRGIRPDSVTYNSLVRACCAEKDTKNAVIFIKRASKIQKIQIAPALYDVTIKLCVADEKYHWAESMVRCLSEVVVSGGGGGNLKEEDLELRRQFVQLSKEESSRSKKKRASKNESVAIERVKFWVGLPNNYYDYDE